MPFMNAHNNVLNTINISNVLECILFPPHLYVLVLYGTLLLDDQHHVCGVAPSIRIIV